MNRLQAQGELQRIVREREPIDLNHLRALGRDAEVVGLRWTTVLPGLTFLEHVEFPAPEQPRIFGHPELPAVARRGGA